MSSESNPVMLYPTNIIRSAAVGLLVGRGVGLELVEVLLVEEPLDDGRFLAASIQNTRPNIRNKRKERAIVDLQT